MIFLRLLLNRNWAIITKIKWAIVRGKMKAFATKSGSKLVLLTKR